MKPEPEQISRIIKLKENLTASDIALPPEEEAIPWPDDLAEEALYGLPGEVVRAIDPYTEADPANVLLTFLAAFGNVIGRGPHLVVGADRHYTNIFPAIVGETSKARKGMAWPWVKGLLTVVDPEWVKNRVASGLVSGEGLIYHVRDPVVQPKKSKKDDSDNNWITEKPGEVEIIDPGVKDKRLIVFEPEFASVLKAAARKENTLSPVIRNAFDTGDLQTLAKNSPTKATGAHITIIVHTTKTELLQNLTKQKWQTDSVIGLSGNASGGASTCRTARPCQKRNPCG